MITCGPYCAVAGAIIGGAAAGCTGYKGGERLKNNVFNESDGDTEPDFDKVNKNDQLGEREWTEEEIEDLVDNTDPIGDSRDQRGPKSTSDGKARDDPATVYGSKDKKGT